MHPNHRRRHRVQRARQHAQHNILCREYANEPRVFHDEHGTGFVLAHCQRGVGNVRANVDDGEARARGLEDLADGGAGHALAEDLGEADHLKRNTVENEGGKGKKKE